MGFHSLRDKLLQAGLVNEEQVKKAEEAARREAQARRQGKGPRKGKGQGAATRPPSPPRPLTEEERRAREEEEAFRQRQRELERERQENRKRAAEDRKRMEALRALAEKYEIADRGEEAFHYVSRKKKLLRMYLTKEQIAALEAGELAIIDKPTPAELVQVLVPREAAEQALAIDPRALRFYNRGPGATYGFVGDADAAKDAPAEANEGAADEAASD